ncbi:MAG TPA: response regulator [Acidobacteriota bacterium]|nr:response regulator [Acidobacteriota bacterium]
MQVESDHTTSDLKSEDGLEQKAITPLRILFVDDDDTIREAMVAILAWFGHETISAAGGKEAIDLYRSNKVDLVITDHYMPDMKGFELAQQIRSMNADAKIILLTGWNNVEKEANSSFINYTLMKPVTMQTVLDTIRSLFPESL